MSTAKQLAEKLLGIKAIQINTAKPYVWSSGWNSPVYCDNRKALSDFHLRRFITACLCDIISEKFPNVEAISGVSTAGIPWATSVADYMQMPLTYVRAKPKEHGLGNQIEGIIIPGQKTVVIEDLVSTGKSSLQVAQVLIDAGVDVIGMAGLFTYGFPAATQAFESAGIPLYTISDYASLMVVAEQQELILPEQRDTLAAWSSDPANWLKEQKA